MFKEELSQQREDHRQDILHASRRDASATCKDEENEIKSIGSTEKDVYKTDLASELLSDKSLIQF